jgi:hypothetical protein
MSNPVGRPGIGFAEVAAVADRIAARGERPTARAVLLELGRGSLATIQRHFTAWKEGHRPSTAESLALPPELQRAMLAHIERATAEARATLQAELTDAHAERDGLLEELERQGAALVAAEERTREQAAQIDRQGGIIATLERALAEAKEQTAREHEAAESARREAAQATVRIEDLPHLRAELDELRSKLDTEREARREAEIEAAELRGHLGQRSPTLPLDMPVTGPEAAQERLFDPGPTSRPSRRKKGS